MIFHLYWCPYWSLFFNVRDTPMTVLAYPTLIKTRLIYDIGAKLTISSKQIETGFLNRVMTNVILIHCSAEIY